MGQHKPIFATRFIIGKCVIPFFWYTVCPVLYFVPLISLLLYVENTIEERILKLQEKKKLVFDGTVGGDAGSIARLTVDDMRFLFQ